jgi:hypothetical protein
MEFFIFIFWVQTNEPATNKKNLFKGSFFIFPEHFFPQAFFHFIWFEEKKTKKKWKFNSEWKIFPHSNFYWRKEKRKYEKRVRFHMHFEAQWFFDWRQELL